MTGNDGAEPKGTLRESKTGVVGVREDNQGLLSPSDRVRTIITKAALQEGRACTFAYPDLVFKVRGADGAARIVALETTGDHLQKPDSEYKRALMDFLTSEFA
jgi:hypothetical protein